MKKTKVLLIIFVVAVLAITLFIIPGCETTTTAAAETTAAATTTTVAEVTTTTAAAETTTAEVKKIGIIYLFLRDEYFQAVQSHFQRLDEETPEVELVEIDGDFNVEKFAKATEDMIAAKVDGVIYCSMDPAVAIPQVTDMQEAGIEVLVYNIQAGPGVDAPYIGGSEYENGRAGGKVAGQYFLENFPGQDAKIVVTECSFLEVSNQRRDGFIVGFKEGSLSSIGVELVGHADKDCSREGSLSAFEDFLQTGIEFNVIYGVNDDCALGSLSALEASGKADPKKILTVGYGGGEGAITKLLDPNSPLKVEIGQPPKDNAEAAWQIINNMLAGEEVPVLTWWPVVVMTPDSPGIDTWVEDQYGLIRK